MLNFPFYNPMKKSLNDYIKLSNTISMNKMKERYSKIKSKEHAKIQYNINCCDLSDFSDFSTISTNYESDCDDSDHDNDKKLVEKNNQYTRWFILYFIGTGSIISLSFVFYKIYILYII